MAGQRPFRPPNVSGWDEERWLDTSSYRGRWFAVSYITRKDEIETDELLEQRDRRRGGRQGALVTGATR